MLWSADGSYAYVTTKIPKGANMSSAEIRQQMKQLIAESNADFLAAAGKGSIGGAGAAVATMANLWIGVAVGIVTFAYMCLQLDNAWRKRKAAIKKERELPKQGEEGVED